MSVTEHLTPRLDHTGNFYMFGATSLAALAWGLAPLDSANEPIQALVAGGMALGAIFGAIAGGGTFYSNYKLRKLWEHAQTAYQEKDDFLMREEDRAAAGMRDAKGRLIGTDLNGRPVFLPHKLKPAFEYNLGAQGTGKTTTATISSSILTPLVSGKSVFINDCKKEIMPQVIETLRKKLGIEVLCVNIGAGAQDSCPGVEVPPFELAIDAYYSTDPALHQLSNTFIRGYGEIAVEMREDEKTPFFGENARKVFHGLFVYLLIYEPDNVTPTRILEIASDMKVAVECLKRLRNYKSKVPNTVVEDGQKAAATLLDMHADTPKYLPQFLNKLCIGLSCYDATGPLANFGREAVGRISDMRKRPMVFASMIPLANLNDMRTHTSFLAYNFFMSAKAFPTGREMHGILDEFTALNLPNYADEMLTLRGLGVSAEMYIQSRIALEKRVGEQGARVIFEQSDIWQMSGLSYEDAKFMSEVLGTRTVRHFRGSVKGQDFEDVGFGGEDREEPLFSIQELMALPKDEQIIRVRGLRPDHLKKLAYWEVGGLKQLVAENPLEGPAPDVPSKLKLKINKKGFKVLSWTKHKTETPKHKPPKKQRLFQASSFIWLYAWLAIIFFGGLSFAKPVPHFYFAQSHRGCEYLSLDGRWRVKPDRDCLPVWIRQEGC